MADEHDDLLNFEIGEGDYADGTLNEDELLLSDEENFEDTKEPAKPSKPEVKPHKAPETKSPPKAVEVKSPPKKEELKTPPKAQEIQVEEVQSLPKEPEAENQSQVEAQKKPTPEPELELQPQESDLQGYEEPVESQSEPPQSNEQEVLQQPHVDSSAPPQFPMGSHRPFRPQKFQPRNWNGMPRWPQGQFPGQRPPLRGAPGPMMGHPPGPPQMRPGGPFPQGRPPFFGPPGARPPQQRFFFQNQPGRPPAPNYVPSPIQPGPAPMGAAAMPRKVLINPNFKGGIEAVKTQLMKEHFSQPLTSEEELLRKQEEFINRNMRSIEKRKYERSPSPNYRRSYSHSPSPPRYQRRRFNRGGGGNYGERRRSFGDKTDKKDENDPNEDEETRAYRKEIEKQRKQREEIFKQKELRRKQLLEAKAKEAKEKEPEEPLKPIVVTEKKIILNKKPRLEEKSTTPPLSEIKATTARRIVLKPSKDISQEGLKVGIAGAEKKKIQDMIQAGN